MRQPLERGSKMRFVGNVIWFVFGGAVLALIWLLGAVIFAVSIVGLPLTRSALEMAKMSAFPFGKTVVHVRELDGRVLSATTAATGTIRFILMSSGRARSGLHSSLAISLRAYSTV